MLVLTTTSLSRTPATVPSPWGQAGVAPNSVLSLASTPRADGSIVLAGITDGEWDGGPFGVVDFVAVALDEDGVELWRYQVREHPAPGLDVNTRGGRSQSAPAGQGSGACACLSPMHRKDNHSKPVR